MRSRRNKAAVSGQLIPSRYIKNYQHAKVIHALIRIFQSLNHPDKLKLVLSEISLLFFVKKQKINIEKGSSLSRLVMENKLFIPVAFHELLPFSSVVIGDEDDQSLQNIHALNFQHTSDEDLLGFIYMSLSNIGNRKNQGSYYTPTTIVNQLVNQSLKGMDRKSSIRVLDPCCGSGTFLIRAFIQLRNELEEKGLSRKETETLLLLHSLHGYDIDPIAVSLTKINLLLLAEEVSLDNLPNMKLKNPLLHTMKTDSFDVILGNPPWGSKDFSEEQKRFFKSTYCTASSSSIETFKLFVEYAINHIHLGGILSFVLPKSLLDVKAHRDVRKILLKNTTIITIESLSETAFNHVFSPAVTITVKKRSPELDHKVTITCNSKYGVLQSVFLDNIDLTLNVHAKPNDQRILKKMEQADCFYLKDQASFAMGIVTGNNNDLLTDSPINGMEPIYKGINIYKYNMDVSDCKYTFFNPKEFQQAAPEKMYRAREKLFYRFINSQLVFAYDDQQRLSLNSANILIPRVNGYSIKYILAVLNSRAAQYYFSYRFSSVKILRRHIEQLPIPRCTVEEQKRIVEMVNEIIREKDAERITKYEQIDQLILDLYKLDPQQKEYMCSEISPKYIK